MESNFELQRLSAFLDEALDPSQQLETRAALNADTRLRAELEALRKVRGIVRTRATRYALPERLEARIRCAVAQARADEVDERRPWRVFLERRPWAQARWAIAMVAAVGMVAGGLKVAVPRFDADHRLMEAAVSSHIRATAEFRLVDMASTDRDAVTAWLSTRLAFSAASPEPGKVPARLVGGRIDSLEGRSTAALVYRQDEHIVDVFVLPMSTGRDSISTTSLRGYTVSHWSHGGLRYCVVSDLPRGPLVAFVQALKQADDAS